MVSLKLKAIYFSIGVALAGLIMDIEHSLAEEALNGFTIEYAHGTSLSDEDIDSVVDLANLAGIGEISSISTVHTPPSNGHMIQVREKSTDDEPYLRYRVLSVGSEKLFYKNGQTYSRELAKSRGGVIIDGFWEVGIRNVAYFPTEFNGEEFEIKVDAGIKRDDLLQVLDALNNNRVEYFFNDTDEVWSSATRGLPDYIRLGPKIEELGRPDYELVYGTFSYYVLLKENKLVILTVGQSTA